jgi:Na+-driven multidrug efflux pump
MQTLTDNNTHFTDGIHSIGNLLGENKANRAGVAANTSIVLAVMIALFFSMLLLIFRKSWARMFNDDPGAISFRFVSGNVCVNSN